MILGIGTDLVENERIEKAYRQFGIRFLKRIFTEEEITYSTGYPDPIPHLSARFAAKEALIKSLNIQESIGIRFSDIEISGRNYGKKRITLYNKIESMAQERGVNRLHLTMSHAKGMSMAVVVLED